MSETPFTLGLTYWPRRTASNWWAAFDRGAVHDELAHIAALGFDQVRFLLRWEDVQTGPQRVNGGVLSAFERTLEVAASAGLRVVVGLFPVAMGGGLHAPRWVCNGDPLEELRQVSRFGAPLATPGAVRQQVIYENSYHDYDLRDLLRDPSARAAQRYLVREVVGYFGSHPAIDAWQLGEGLERLRKPDSAEGTREWFRALAEAVDEARRGAATVGVVSTRALEVPAGPRPEHLVNICNRVALSVEAPPAGLPQRPLDVDAVLFLYTLASSLAERPLTLAGLGQPTAPDGQTGWTADALLGIARQTYLAHPQEQAEFIGTALERLYAAGAAGIWLSDYADYPPELWRLPPLDRAVSARTRGLVDRNGREKPVADAVRSFAARLRAERAAATVPSPAQQTPPAGTPPLTTPGQAGPAAPVRRFSPLPLDSERYWRDPRRELEALWTTFSNS
ncbi:MAG TPA: hypothetical protein VFS21_37825 [Roseiflexaceae bacterium]|nr:hypothetical protein [Roseiflexaceae bacterium]